MKYSLLISLFLFSIGSFAQSDSGKEIVLKNEIKLYPFILNDQVNSPSTFIDEAIAPTEVFDGYYFRLVRFSKNLTSADWEKLTLLGVKNEAYIPFHSWILAIPIHFNKESILSLNPQQIVSLSVTNKIDRDLSLRLLENTNPDETLQINLQCYKSLQVSIVEAELNKWSKINPLGTHQRTYEITLKASQVRNLAALPFVKFMELSPGVPIPDDTRGKSLHRSNFINNNQKNGLRFNGKGVTISLADDGPIGPHIDFKGRLRSFATANVGTHGDMTSGIAVGSGNLDPRYNGMADGAFLNLYDIGSYPQINNAVANFNTYGAVITSTSYSQGCNQYTISTQDGDNKLLNNPQFNFVFSAGNNGSANCNYGAGAGWGNITGGYKVGKNVLAVANTNPYGIIDNTSSKGPAPDGRIKPDISANGQSQMSTDEDYTYSVGGGTSAACPGIAGVTAQLYQAYKETFQVSNPDGGLIKAVLLNTADDIGRVGPDFIFGWGVVNARRAYETIANNQMKTDTLADGDSITFSINIPAGIKEAKIMAYWTDPAGEPNATVSLVNNLDLKIRNSAGETYLPWVLDPTPTVAAITSPATKGIDDLNNMEQVSILSPAPGSYTVVVYGKSIPDGPQKFFMVHNFIQEGITITYPIGGEGFVPSDAETIRWDAFGETGSFSVSYSSDSGSTWSTVGTAPANQRYINWSPPNIATGRALIRVVRGTEIGISPKPFSIIALPTNLTYTRACPDSFSISWNLVSGAVAYEVSRLGDMYMDSAGTTTATSITLPYFAGDTLWTSVRAILPNGGKGRRAVAVRKNPGLLNCIVQLDAAVSKGITPRPVLAYPCNGFTNYPVSILLHNSGVQPIGNFPVTFRLGTNPSVTETYSTTIQPGDSVVYTFNATLNLVQNTNYRIYVVSKAVGDLNFVNDSINYAFKTSANPSNSFSQTFQTATFPPIGWGVDNQDANRTWIRSINIMGPMNVQTYAAYMNNQNYLPANQMDALLTPAVDFTNNENPAVVFDLAYAPQALRRDTLSVLFSTNCGLTFEPTSYRKGGLELSTTAPRATLFSPTASTQWRTDTVLLTGAAGAEVIVKFLNKSGGGNSLYLDNIRTITAPVSTSKNYSSTGSLTLFPNPATKTLYVVSQSIGDGQLKNIRVYGLEGKLISISDLITVAENRIELDITSLRPGMYWLQAEGKSGQTFREKFVVQ